MKNVTAVLAALALAGVAVPAQAGDVSAGKAKANTCVACHGVNGISNSPMYPNLAGQKAQYLAKQMKEFRDGKRQDPIMGAMAKPLSDADIANLAAYYASLSAQ